MRGYTVSLACSQFLVVPDVGIADARLSIHKYPKMFTTDEQGYYTIKYKVQNLKNPPKRLVLKATKDGYFPLVKVLLVTDNIIDTIRDVYFDMTKVGSGFMHMFYPSLGIDLHTINNAVIRIPPGTRFKYEDDNTDVVGKVGAALRFIDRNREIVDSPGEFIASGQNLLAFSVFNLIFRDSNLRNILPKDLIIVQIVNTRIEDISLWKLNDNGRWVQLSEKNRAQNDNIQIVGHLHGSDIGKWLTLGQLDDHAMCYVKLRVFEDLSFTKEVLDNQADLYSPDIALKILNASHPRSSMALLLRPLEGTRLPSQDCHVVRCTDIKSISGGISVLVTETRGDMTSIPIPAIPIPKDHPNLPATLKSSLTALGYGVDHVKTRASLRFEASPNGPFYTDEEACRSSTINANSMWFARRTPIFSDKSFGDKVCLAKVRIYFDSLNHGFVDSLTATSIWGTNPAKFGTSTVRNTLRSMTIVTTATPSIFRFFACVRYRCGESNELTKVYLKLAFNEINHGISCDEEMMRFTPNVVYADGGGYFVGSDESEVRDKCFADANVHFYAHNVECADGM